MDLNEFKVAYSNCHGEYAPVMENFWKNFDAEGYSLWRMEYDPYEGECEDLLMTENLVGMFT